MTAFAFLYLEFLIARPWLLLWSPRKSFDILALYKSDYYYYYYYYVIGQAIIFLPCDFYLLSSSSFFPRLISAAAGWMSTIL